MGACKVDGRDERAIESVEEMAGRFCSELMTLMPAIPADGHFRG